MINRRVARLAGFLVMGVLRSTNVIDEAFSAVYDGHDEGDIVIGSGVRMSETVIWPYVREIWWLGFVAMVVGYFWACEIATSGMSGKATLLELFLPTTYVRILDHYNHPDPKQSTTRPVWLIAGGSVFFFTAKLFVDWVEGYK